MNPGDVVTLTLRARKGLSIRDARWTLVACGCELCNAGFVATANGSHLSSKVLCLADDHATVR